MAKEKCHICSSGCACRWIGNGAFLVFGVLLLLVGIEVISPASVYGEWILKLWPIAFIFYGLSGFCPCKKCKEC